MENDNPRIDNIMELLKSFQKLIMYKKDTIVLYSIEKLIIMSSTLLLVGILCIVGGLVLLHLSFTLSYFLAPHVGGVAVSHLITTVILVLAGIIIYVSRKKMIVQPITRFLTRLFLTKQQ